jgi:hypothetical protein
LKARHAQIGGAFVKRANKRCQARSSSSAPPAGTPTTFPSPSPTPDASPTTTSSTYQPPAASTPAPSSSGGKAGLAFSVWDNNVATILQNFKIGQVSRIYNWTPQLVPGAGAAGYQNIPMLWGTKDLDTWEGLTVPGYATVALGFNEPDIQSQSYLDPTYASTLWKEYMLPLRSSGYTLVSPATTSGSGGITWMQTFLNACGPGCVDRLALHWYGTDSQALIEYIQLWHNTFNMNIWVTEFACMDFVNYQPCPNVEAFASTVKNFMESTWYVEAYFPFAISYSLGNVDSVNQLLGGNLDPTTLALTYFN